MLVRLCGHQHHSIYEVHYTEMLQVLGLVGALLSLKYDCNSITLVRANKLQERKESQKDSETFKLKLNLNEKNRTC